MSEPSGGSGKQNISFPAAALGRCPVCGKGRLYTSYLKIADSCDRCDASFKAAETGDGPVVFVILIAGFAACAGLFYSFVVLGWTPLRLLIVWPAVAIALSLVLMPVLKGLMVASQLRHKVRD